MRTAKPSEYLLDCARAAFEGTTVRDAKLTGMLWPYVELIQPTPEDERAFTRIWYRPKDHGRALRLCLAAAIAESDGN